MIKLLLKIVLFIQVILNEITFVGLYCLEI